ncbi:hypothetical protein N0V93_009904 [Gnomoniopsis smithogilvyi]|uniref:Uncharacterized protein n=1 Tax=Gnomoniopsis smithogilvyi TaxID=1191159 RepID=A0A9W8YJ11_9PEZI|nr:hypothetical protein N0V93_009904 [Gnomoniopsis smithogilvyi]
MATHPTSSPNLPKLGPWTRPITRPIIIPNVSSTFHDPVSGKQVHWEALHTFNPAAVVRNNQIHLLYRAEDDSGGDVIGGHISRLGLAISDDGLNFQRMPEPVVYPADDDQKEREVPGGTEDPRLVESPSGGYILTYTQWSREKASYSVGIATSLDLHHWKKHGPAFAGALQGRYDNLKYKSAGIVTRLGSDGRLVATKVKGKYWMYWGEVEIGLAFSDDLIHWTPCEDAPGKLLVLLRARPSRADSGFPEVGPPPVLTERGIVVLYNGKNADGDDRDQKRQAGTYSVLEALFSAVDPTRLLGRTEEPVFEPELPFERTGQYAAGTTFVEGLILFREAWWLYYGAADSFVGVATTPFQAYSQRRPHRPTRTDCQLHSPSKQSG